MMPQKPSPELVAANERLLHMRAQYQNERSTPTLSWQMDLPFQRETMASSRLADRLDLNTAGGAYSLHF